MDITAAAHLASAAAPLASAAGPSLPAAAPASSAPHCPDKNYKSRLNEWTQRKGLISPQYRHEYTCSVEVDGLVYQSASSYAQIAEAQQDAARVACENLLANDDDQKDDQVDLPMLLRQSINISKTILYAFSVKTNGTTPSYVLCTQEGPPHMPMFAASVNFAGKSYYGERKASKKDSEQAAACAAILSILDEGDTCMQQIVKSTLGNASNQSDGVLKGRSVPPSISVENDPKKQRFLCSK